MVTQDELNWLNGAIQVGLKVELSQEMRFSGKNLVDLLVHKAGQYRFVDLEYVHLYICVLIVNNFTQCKASTHWDNLLSSPYSIPTFVWREIENPDPKH